MKKLLLVNIIFFFVFSATVAQIKKYDLEYQNDNIIQTIGIGLVQLVNVDDVFLLYADTTFTKVKAKKAIIGDNVVPLLNKPDYGILYFTCVAKNSKYYKIVIDKNTFAYLKASGQFVFYNWDTFLKNKVISVESQDLNKNPPRNGINGKTIETRNWEDDDEITVVKIQEDWVQLKNVSQKNKLYWIQWKEKNQLKVYLNLLM